jgi:hypothetical protein
MAYRFWTIRELAEDLKAELEDLLEADMSATFRDVGVFRQTRWADLAKHVESQLPAPAAVIVPDARALDETTVRNRRQSTFRVYLIAGFPADVDGAGLDAHDLADSVIQHFLPDETDKATPFVLNDVAWQPLGHEPVDTATHTSVVRLDFIASDDRLER